MYEMSIYLHFFLLLKVYLIGWSDCVERRKKIYIKIHKIDIKKTKFIVFNKTFEDSIVFLISCLVFWLFLWFLLFYWMYNNFLLDSWIFNDIFQRYLFLLFYWNDFFFEFTKYFTHFVTLGSLLPVNLRKGRK